MIWVGVQRVVIAEREPFWYLPLYDPQRGASSCAVLRDGDYKLVGFFGNYIEKKNNFNYIPGGRVELYKLAEDLGEKNDAAGEFPEKTAQMKSRLYEWIVEMGEDTCRLDPQFDSEPALYRPVKVR